MDSNGSAKIPNKPSECSWPFDDIKFYITFAKEFDEKLHEHYVRSLQSGLNDMENIVNLLENEATDFQVEMVNRAFKVSLGAAVFLLKNSFETVKFDDSACHICLESQPTEPLYCLQCLRVIGCKSCMREWIQTPKRLMVKCLNCQRKSFGRFPLFFSKRVDEKKEEKTE